LGHVGADVLNREVAVVALECRVQLRQLVKPEMARCDANVMRDARRLRAKTIEFETKCNYGVVVRPDLNAGLLAERVRMPHPVHMSGAIRRSTTFLARKPQLADRNHQMLVRRILPHDVGCRGINAVSCPVISGD
jgi:hypothetical protein